MQIESDLLYYDFQGWPVYRMNLREILENLEDLGIIKKLQTLEDDKYIIRINPAALNTYPEILEDDGMGYSPVIKYICGVEKYNNTSRLWVDQFDTRLKERENEQNKELVNESAVVD